MKKNGYLQRLLEDVHVKFLNDPLPTDLRTRFPDTKGPLGKNLTYRQLHKYPDLQEALAFIVHYTPMEKNEYLQRLLEEVHVKFVNDPLPADLRTRFPDIKARLGKDLTYRQLHKNSGLQQALAFILHYTQTEKNGYLKRLLEDVHVKFVNDPLPADLHTRFPHIKGPLGKDLTDDELDKDPHLQEALAFILHYTQTEKINYLKRLLKEVHVKFVNDPLPDGLRTRFPDIKGPLAKDLTDDELAKYPHLQKALAFIVHYTPTNNDYLRRLLEKVHVKFANEPLPADLRTSFPDISAPLGKDLTCRQLDKYPRLQEALAFILYYTQIEKNNYLQWFLEKVKVKFVKDPLPAASPTRSPHIKAPLGKDLTYRQLDKYPGLQEALAFIVHYTPSKWLLEQEAPEIRKRRILHQWRSDTPEFKCQDAVPDCSQADAGDIYCWARNNEISGICFSGGGIRSATFNLGILQGLASRGSLHQFDYLSSVSGGGYIHSWLAAWLKRRTSEERDKNQREKAGQDDLRAAWNHVTYRLNPLPGRTELKNYQTVWPRQIQWLRRYSNYLTPQVGLFTSDTWSAIAMWIRNSALNQTLLITMFLCLLCFPHLLAPSVRLGPNPSVACATDAGSVGLGAGVVPKALQPCLVNKTKAAPTGISPDRYFRNLFLEYWHGRWTRAGIVSFYYKVARAGTTIIAALFCFAIGIVLVIHLLRWEYDLAVKPVQSAEPTAEFMLKLRRHQVLVANLMLCLLLTFAILWTLITLQHPKGPAYPVALFLLFLCLVCAETFAGGALAQMMTRRTQTLQWGRKNPKKWERLARAKKRVRLILRAIPAAATGAVAGVAIAALLQSWRIDSAANWLGLTGPWSLRLVLGTILFFWLAPFTMVLASGFIGKDFPDWLSEWLGRIRAYSLMMGIVWVFLCGSSLLMPTLFLHLSTPWERWIKWPAVLTWTATTAASVLGGKSSKTSGKTNGSTSRTVLEVVVLIGPYVYIAGLVFILSLVLEKVHGPLADNLFYHSDLLFWVSAIAVFLFMAGWLGYRLDINEFSMHTLYRNRLTRCYLGASNLTRSPSPVTGFDQRDTADLQIAQLAFDREYPGPIPIFCCAMNITLGEDLAWQQRKAASFAFTPYYSGYTVGWTEARKGLRFNGFVPTEFLYEGDPSGTKEVGGPNLATAMAASGAAVSPNWGYHTNPATAFLMTMFDVRLGLWIPNPRHSPLAGQKLGVRPDTSPKPASPVFAPARLTSELLGSVSDTSTYVYLTDGGHFDNMGLYELVRRRCYKIVICDAEEDGDYSYEGIGSAIRKCRIDFGAEIELDLSPTRPNAKSGLSTAHIIRGTIRYPETPPGKEGDVWYIKASLTGKPPAAGEKRSAELPYAPGDVQNYKLQHSHFPHDSTAEQWFTESQFESYRRLGQSIVDGLLTPPLPWFLTLSTSLQPNGSIAGESVENPRNC